MPITCKFTPQTLSQDEFHAIDKIVMRQAFDIQNEMGRLFDETIYQNELAFRCRSHGLEVLTEGVISVEYRDSRKLYFLDMLTNNGGIYKRRTKNESWIQGGTCDRFSLLWVGVRDNESGEPLFPI